MSWQRLAVPDDAIVDIHRDWLLIKVRSPWEVNGVTYPVGTLLAVRVRRVPGRAARPGPCCSSQTRTPRSATTPWTRNHLILNLLHDVRSELVVLTPSGGQWQRVDLPGVPRYANTDIAEHGLRRQR